MNEADGRVIRSDERGYGELRYGRGIVERIIGPEIGARQVDLHLNRIRSGSPRGPYHLHPESENVYYVLSGELVVRIRGTDHRLGPGDAAFVKAGVPHSASNLGSIDVELIEIYAPAEPGFVEISE